MDTPLDFTLDRARILSASSIGTFESGFDATHPTVLGRTGAGGNGLQDISRVSTPATSQYQGQYQGRYLPPSLSIPTQDPVPNGPPDPSYDKPSYVCNSSSTISESSRVLVSPSLIAGGYSMMSSFLSGGAGTPMADHLKTIFPELQYWNPPADGCARYIVNNNTIYSPYLSYLPATESLSLFAHNVGVAPPHSSGQAPLNYHRMYDLQKEALYNGTPHIPGGPTALFPPSSGISPPSTRVSESLNQPGNLSVKKESGRHGDSKRSSENKHVKSADSQKSLTAAKYSKDPDRKGDSKKHQDKQQDKTGEVKQEHTKSCSKQDIVKETDVPKTLSSCQVKSKSPTRVHVDKQKQHSSPVHSEKDNESNCDKESDESETNNKSECGKHASSKGKSGEEKEIKQRHVPTLKTVTMTSGQSVTSPQMSPKSVGMLSPPPNKGAFSPESNGVPVTSVAPTSTTFSLPYYHSIYSHSQPTVPESKKVHAPTFTPEIGTLPSVVAMTTIPVQTTACDMRIKKEKGSYSCCKEKCSTSVSPCVVSQQICVSPSATVQDSKEGAKQNKKSPEVKDTKSRRALSKVSDSRDKSAVLVKSQISVSPTIPTKPVIPAICDTDSNSVIVTPKAVESEKTLLPKEQHVVHVRATGTEGKGELNTSTFPCREAKKPTVEKATEEPNHHAEEGVVCPKVSLKSSTTNSSDKDKSAKCVKAHCVVSEHDGTRKTKDTKAEGAVKPVARDIHVCKPKELKPKLPDKNIRHRETRRKCDGHGKDDNSSTIGMNIPIGIAVAQKREEFKEENVVESENDPVTEIRRSPGDIRRSPREGEQRPNASSLHRTDGQPSAFAGPVISKSTSPNTSVSDMRNALPANLIVTGSANGAGIAWSDDPAARHFPSPWLQAGHGMNPTSWIGQMPFTLPPPNIPTSSGTTDPGQLPLSVPPGYKLVQDSVTGHLIIMPATNLEMYDPSRMWPGGFPGTGHPSTFQQLMAVHQQNQLQHPVLTHPERQSTSEFALAFQQYQQLQQMYQSRPETGSTETSAPSSGQTPVITEQQTKSSESSTSSKEIYNSNKNSCPSTEAETTEKDKPHTQPVVPHPPLPDLGIHNGQSLSYQYPALPLVYNTGLVSAIPVSIQETVKTETSTVQSRGTSPMVPASEIDDTSQETIDATPSTTESMCDILSSESNNVSQSIASVQTCTTDVSCSTVPVTSVTCTLIKEKQSLQTTDDKAEETSDNEICDSTQHDAIPKEEQRTEDTQAVSVHEIVTKEEINSSCESVKNVNTTETSVDVVCPKQAEINQSQNDTSDNYNPFLDPQILQAADGLELLSTLAEIRAKGVQLETPQAPQAPNNNMGFGESLGECNKEDNKGEAKVSEELPKGTKDTETPGKVTVTEKSKPGVHRSCSDTPKSPKKRQLSRTRSIPAKSETKSEPANYYTSTGLKIPQGEEEINAIELDMRIRLAELQRLYKEKQRQLARLHPKREKDDALSKRGPGRPRKRKYPPSKQDPQKPEPVPMKSQNKTKEPAKKKKQAEELVDRVFRKTGGGFGMPLSKKLKANAMAALFKTQSGFTVKRKGIASSLPGGGKSCDSIKLNEKEQKPQSKKQETSKTSAKSYIINKGNLKAPQGASKKIVPSKKESFTSTGMKSESFNSSHVTKETKPKKQTQNIDENKSEVVEDNGSSKLGNAAEESGLGMLAKYASCAMEHSSAKKRKREEEGVCNTSSKPDVSSTTTQNESLASTCKEPQANTASPSSNTDKPAVKRETESDATPESSAPVNKKRKPGRPRKCNPNTTPGVTETIVARNSKNFFYQFHSFEDVVKAHSKTSEQERKTKVESSSPLKSLILDEEWFIRRSERIFLSEPSPQPSPNINVAASTTPKASSVTTPPSKKSPPMATTSPTKSKSEKAKLQKAKNIKELTQKVKKKYSKAFQNKNKTSEAKQKPKPKKERSKSEPVPVCGYESDSSGSDNIPLSVLREMPSAPEPRSCVIEKEELIDNLRVLVFKDGLFYEGAVQAIRPPDVYGVLIDNERGNRPHIYSQEEILKEVIVDVKPSSTRSLLEGTRVCAYWSQQFSCLYPGTVAKGSPTPHTDKGSINVEFDDGDSGRIPLDHIRMLPKDFPQVSYDPNPLLLIGKRRRHTTSESIEPARKSQSSVQSTDSTPKQKRGPGRPPKVKKDDATRRSECASAEDEEEEVDVCGFDEDRDNVFTSGFSLENFRKERAKSSSSSKDTDKKYKRKEKSSEVSSKDSEKESQTNARRQKDKGDNFSDDSDDSDTDSASSEQGKSPYHCKDTSIKTKNFHVTSLIRAATFEYKTSGSFHVLNRNKSESRIRDMYVESDRGLQQWDGDCYSYDEDDSTSGHQAKPKCTKRSLSTESKSKIAAFLPARQLWRWSGKCTKRPGLKGKAKKEFYKAIVRGKENILVGDCAVFLSTGRPHLPYIGRIDSMWEAWGGQMVVKVKWFYHPEETRGGKKLQDMKGALFQSLHIDENDVQTISHKCEVLSYKEYCRRRKEVRKKGGHNDEQDVYYLAGTYEPTIGLLKFEKDMAIG